MAIPMQRDGGGKTVDEYVSELDVKTYTFDGRSTSLITFPETGVYLVVLPCSHVTIAGRSNCEFLITPTVVTNNSGGGYASSFCYALVQSNGVGSSWRTDAFRGGASGETSAYILAKLF